MDAHRVYLRGELARLSDVAVAGEYLEATGHRGFGASPEEVALGLSTQESVDAAVASMTALAVDDLTRRCSAWRNNGVIGLMDGMPTSCVEAPIELVRLCPAESRLGPLFAAHDWRVVDIARDRRVLDQPEYRDRLPGEPVRMAVLVADRWPAGGYRLVDGMHRAIQLARNGDASVELCVVG